MEYEHQALSADEPAQDNQLEANGTERETDRAGGRMAQIGDVLDEAVIRVIVTRTRVNTSEDLEYVIQAVDSASWADLMFAQQLSVRALQSLLVLFHRDHVNDHRALNSWYLNENARLGNRVPAIVVSEDASAFLKALEAWVFEVKSGESPVSWPPDEISQRMELIASAQELLGDPLAEVILTHDPDHLTGLMWAMRVRSDEEIEPLREAVSIADYLSAKEANSVIRIWFAGLNPMLGDREPALVIRENPQAVRNAAQAHLASG